MDLKKLLVNGHFDPLTLSIVESGYDTSWREIESQPNVTSSFEDLKKFKQIEDWRLFAELTNIHEQDHFIKHVTSGLGILFTLLCIVKHAALNNIVLTLSNDPGNSEIINFRKSIFNKLNDVSLVLFENLPNVTQAQAVDILNGFYKMYFDIDDLFVARNPEYPASPSSFHGYSNILEASAVGAEIRIAQMAGLNENERNEFLRIKNRNQILYFELYNHLKKQVHYDPACNFILGYALDAQLPFINTTGDRKFYWDEIHPGWRLYRMEEAIKVNFEHYTFFDEKIKGFYQDKHQYIPDFQFHMFQIFESCLKSNFDHDSFYERSLKESNRLTFSSFLSNLKPDFLPFFQNEILVRFGNIINHIYYAYNRFSEECSKGPLNFYCGTFAGFSQDIRDEMKNIPSKFLNTELLGTKRGESAYALFSIQSNTFTSMYFKEKTVEVLDATFTKAEHIIFECYLAGLKKEETIRKVNNLGKHQIQEFQDYYDSRIDGILTAIYK